MATLLAVTAAYSLLFAAMKSVDFSVSAFIHVAVLVTLVAIAQSLFASTDSLRQTSLLFSNDPRQVSVLVGIVYYITFVDWMYDAAYFWKGIQNGPSLVELGLVLLAILIPGTLMGYFSGVLIGGVFLVAEYLRRFLNWRHSKHEGDQHPRNESPMDD